MDLNKRNVKKIRGLIIFTAVVCLVVINFGTVLGGGLLGLSIIKPFLIGGAIAFVLNIPMSGIEKYLFGRWKNERLLKLKRPLSILLSLLAVILILVLVILTVVPQLTKTLMDLGNKIPIFMEDTIVRLEEIFASQPQLLSWLEDLDPKSINWNSMINNVVEFMKNGIGSVVTSTVSVAGSIISGVVNIFVSLIFSFYVLSQKERLGSQVKRLLLAYIPEKWNVSILKIAALGNKNFNSFITGQCAEAVILGALFVVTMAIFQFPYAVLVGVLIAFTALIPIVGAFIGCFVGTFLILVDDPIKAVWFLILFIILQQLEGNLIYPYVVGNSVGLPSMWVLAAVTIGGSLMGVVGMLIFIPIVSTVYALLREDVNKRNLLKNPPPKAPKKQRIEAVQESGE